MICHASKHALELRLSIGFKASPNAKESVLKMVMSLKRHAYHFIDEGEAKEMNSVCFSSIDVPALRQDAVDVGRQFQKLQESNRFALLNESIDFTAASRRVYRFDEHRGREGFNHFYPLRGPAVWNCDMAQYEWLQAVRRLELNPEDNSVKAKFGRWNAFLENRPEWQELRGLLVDAAGAEKLLADLETELRKPKKKAAQPAAQLSVFGFNRAPSFSDDDSDDSPFPSRSRSSSVSSSSSVTSSGSDSDSDRPGFW